MSIQFIVYTTCIISILLIYSKNYLFILETTNLRVKSYLRFRSLVLSSIFISFLLILIYFC